MIKILFICYGNICRSPMAEFIMKDMLKKQGLDNEFHIQSAATSTEEIWGGRGNPIYSPARAELTKRGVPFDGNKRAVQATKADYDKYDYLICMEAMNVRDLMRIIGFDKDHKVKKLLDFTNHGGDIADPWYSGDFTATYRDIVEGCEAIIKKYKEGTLCQ